MMKWKQILELIQMDNGWFWVSHLSPFLRNRIQHHLWKRIHSGTENESLNDMKIVHALLSLENKNFATALIYLKTALDKAPSEMTLYYYIYALREAVEAEKLFKQVLPSNPGCAYDFQWFELMMPIFFAARNQEERNSVINLFIHKEAFYFFPNYKSHMKRFLSKLSLELPEFFKVADQLLNLICEEERRFKYTEDRQEFIGLLLSLFSYSQIVIPANEAHIVEKLKKAWDDYIIPF